MLKKIKCWFRGHKWEPQYKFTVKSGPKGSGVFTFDKCTCCGESKVTFDADFIMTDASYVSEPTPSITRELVNEADKENNNVIKEKKPQRTGRINVTREDKSQEPKSEFKKSKTKRTTDRRAAA